MALTRAGLSFFCLVTGIVVPCAGFLNSPRRVCDVLYLGDELVHIETSNEGERVKSKEITILFLGCIEHQQSGLEKSTSMVWRATPYIAGAWQPLGIDFNGAMVCAQKWGYSGGLNAQPSVTLGAPTVLDGGSLQ